VLQLQRLQRPLLTHRLQDLSRAAGLGGVEEKNLQHLGKSAWSAAATEDVIRRKARRELRQLYTRRLDCRRDVHKTREGPLDKT
jgi:hypothetical protein